LVQTLFQNGEIAAVAKTIIVQIDEETGNSKPLSEKIYYIKALKTPAKAGACYIILLLQSPLY
jgi:acyl-CoA thioesterase FadM